MTSHYKQISAVRYAILSNQTIVQMSTVYHNRGARADRATASSRGPTNPTSPIIVTGRIRPSDVASSERRKENDSRNYR